MTHTVAYLFDQVKVGLLEEKVEEIRDDWEKRAEYLSVSVLEEGEKRLKVLEGVTEMMRDAV